MAEQRWIEIDGRKWRATDPAVPEPFRQQLVDELMDARRAVGAGRRAHDDAAVAIARSRVQAAKVALGERGEPWWEEPTAEGRRDRFTAAVRALARHRAPDRTICPSDAARAVGGPGWRTHMDLAREVARDLARDGDVVIEQRHQRVDPEASWHGPVRIRFVALP
ncbi:hypothetical protein BH10ACT1_BH10ACT1_12810 [soil metagenome]